VICLFILLLFCYLPNFMGTNSVCTYHVFANSVADDIMNQFNVRLFKPILIKKKTLFRLFCTCTL